MLAFVSWVCGFIDARNVFLWLIVVLIFIFVIHLVDWVDISRLLNLNFDFTILDLTLFI